MSSAWHRSRNRKKAAMKIARFLDRREQSMLRGSFSRLQSQSKNRKYRNPSKQVVVSSIPGHLGTSCLQRFRYVDKITLNPGISTAIYHSFRANDLYDPDYTGVGHQPIGFDQLMNFYNHFTVLGSRIKVTFIASGDNATTSSAVCGIELSGSATPTTAINDIYEQGLSKYKVMTSNQANQKVTVTHSLSVKKFLGQNPLDEDENAGSATSSPAEKIYFHVFATGVNDTYDPVTINCIVELEQIAMLHEPKKLTGS